MVEKLKKFSLKYKDVLIYLIFGVLTTGINYLIYLPCYYALKLSAGFSNVLAWIGAVIFAYLTNKPFVFHSRDWTFKTVGPELGKFMGCRIGSGILETGILMLTVDFLGWNSVLWKLITSVLVVVLNYIGSKLLVFGEKK